MHLNDLLVLKVLKTAVSQKKHNGLVNILLLKSGQFGRVYEHIIKQNVPIYLSMYPFRTSLMLLTIQIILPHSTIDITRINSTLVL